MSKRFHSNLDGFPRMVVQAQKVSPFLDQDANIIEFLQILFDFTYEFECAYNSLLCSLMRCLRKEGSKLTRCLTLQ